MINLIVSVHCATGVQVGEHGIMVLFEYAHTLHHVCHIRHSSRCKDFCPLTYCSPVAINDRRDNQCTLCSKESVVTK